MTPSISLAVIALNEERFLPGLLDSVQDLVTDVVLGVDDRTTDRTAEIARARGARVFTFHWSDSFSIARNLTLERARGEWILVLDPDERLLPEGRVRIAEQLAADIPLFIDGFHTSIVETDLDDQPLSPPEVSSSRLFRNSPDLRYMGRVHEEVRYVSAPPRTWCAMLEGGPHIRHYGLAPTIWATREKRARDRRLLHLRLRDNPNDAVAYCYLALMARREGRRMAAMMLAKRALDCGPGTLHDDRVAQLRQLVH